MTKETLIILIEKEITEIASLTKGFAELNTFPKPLMHLAVEKSENLKNCLNQLAAWKEEKKESVSEQGKSIAEEKIEETSVVEESVEDKMEEPQETQQTEETPEEEMPKVEQKTILAETIVQKTSVLENLVNDEDRIASSIAHQKITDLRTVISIADRFRFQRELFDGNGERMNQAISDFDAFGSMEEAQKYIAKKFKWNETDENVTDFLSLLQRRYL